MHFKRRRIYAFLFFIIYSIFVLALNLREFLLTPLARFLHSRFHFAIGCR